MAYIDKGDGDSVISGHVVPAHPMRCSMAPRRKPPEPGRTNRVNLRLPTDVFERIEAKAKVSRRPFHRIIVDELTLFPHLDRQARFGKLVRDMETLLARYGSRLTLTEFLTRFCYALSTRRSRPRQTASCSSSSIGCG